MLKLTFEQQEIVYSENKHVYVSARAGTGKTTTLTEFVRVRKADTFLYIVYNNSIKEEAITKFPDRTTIHTIHSLAYEKIGHEYKEKLTGNLKVENIIKGLEYFKGKSIEDKETHKIAYTITKLLNEYFNSDKTTISEVSENTFIVKLAEEYWNQMRDKENNQVLITHDGYLKLYHLTKPKLEYDFIMVDEAQDSNEVMLDIVYSQTESKKIFVGDPHQKIYGFRGAINIFAAEKFLKRGEDSVFLSLTESFRFGTEIAAVANILLKDYKGEDNLITGSKTRASEVGDLDKSVQYTVITRTNAKLIDMAIEAVQENKTVNIVGGIDHILRSVMDGYYLFTGQREMIKSEYLKTLNNYFHLKSLAETLKSPEHMLQVYLIEKYGESLEDWIDMIRQNHTGAKSASIVFSTAHKSKGLEFVSVMLANDFAALFSESGNKLEMIESEEINLMYVAMTRATHDLELNKELKRIVEEFK